MTAEARMQRKLDLADRYLFEDSLVATLDLREVISLLASLRAANAEQAAVIERLSQPSLTRTARAGDVAAFIRDPDEQGKVKP